MSWISIGPVAGELHTFVSAKFPFHAFGKKTRAVLGVSVDTTERKLAEQERLRLEHQLRQIQKGESLGRMAGGIAHHFNNMLGVVIGNLEPALDDMPHGSGPGAAIAEAMKAARRAAEISRLMLAYLGQTIRKTEPLDFAETCGEAVPLFDASLPKTVHLRNDLPSPGPLVAGDRVQLEQVLTNLVSNAVDALPVRCRLPRKGRNKPLKQEAKSCRGLPKIDEKPALDRLPWMYYRRNPHGAIANHVTSYG